MLIRKKVIYLKHEFTNTIDHDKVKFLVLKIICIDLKKKLSQ